MTSYEMGKYWLLDALETYRDTPPGTGKRRFIDWLMGRSRDAAKREAANGDETGKKYHNLIALRYIADSRPSKLKICKTLHIGRAAKTRHKGRTVQCYEAVTENAVDRLLVLAFGVDGIDWDSVSDSPAPQEAEGEAAEALTGQTAELARLKYSLVAEMLAGMERHIRESAELSAELRSGIVEAVKTAQARLVLNAAFDLT